MSGLQQAISRTGAGHETPIQSGCQADQRTATHESGTVPEMQKASDVPCVMGEIPDTETVRLYDFMVSIRTQNVPVMNDFLGKLLTLNTALIGGGIALFNSKPAFASPTTIGFIFGCLFFSLLAALFGLMPLPWTYDNSTESLKSIEQDVLFKKSASIYASVIFFTSAILIGIVM